MDTNGSNKKKYFFKLFNIESLTCLIFKYLDFKSLNNCSLVCLSFLYDSYNPFSIFNLNINDLIKIKKTSSQINNYHGARSRLGYCTCDRKKIDTQNFF